MPSRHLFPVLLLATLACNGDDPESPAADTGAAVDTSAHPDVTPDDTEVPDTVVPDTSDTTRDTEHDIPEDHTDCATGIYCLDGVLTHDQSNGAGALTYDNGCSYDLHTCEFGCEARSFMDPYELGDGELLSTLCHPDPTPRAPHILPCDPGETTESCVIPGWDWSVPSHATIAPNSGLFSEEASPDHHIDTRVIDVTWRQLNPAPGVYDRAATGSAQGMDFDGFDEQLGIDGPYWMRIWASGVDWAPEWVQTECGVGAVGTDYDDQDHLPIWEACVWDHLMTLYREVFITWDLRNDDDLRFIYVPGAFTWAEFDLDEIVGQAVENHGLTFPVFHTWFQGALTDLVGIFNGENADTSDDRAYKLVYTGEDYPWSPWGTEDDLLAHEAVSAGMGIRTGITELYNFHLNHAPAYGAHIMADGHVVVDDTWQLFDGRRVAATENECFNDCGYRTDNTEPAVVLANLKALQLHMNWIYGWPDESYMETFPEHWSFVRHSLGQTVASTTDAWVALREYEDVYWRDDDESHSWSAHPWIHNFERWLVQRDVAPDGMTQRGTTEVTGDMHRANGTSYEGRRTDLASGQNSLYFDLDDRLAARIAADPERRAELRVVMRTLDGISSGVSLALNDVDTIEVIRPPNGELETVVFRLDDVALDGSVGDGFDFRLVAAHGDVEVMFVRVVLVP